MSKELVQKIDENQVYVWNEGRTHFYRVGKGFFGCSVELYHYNSEQEVASKIENPGGVQITKTLEDGLVLAKKLIKTIDEK